MKRLSLILLVILIISCSKKPKHNIEIYLLKSRVENSFGIPIADYLKMNKLDYVELKSFRNATFDTVKKQIIYAGKFDILKGQLNDKPFIENQDIKFLDIKRNKIIFTEKASRKIGSLPGKLNEGHQFIITDNGKPIFGGYFWSIFSSYGTNWNTILFTHKLLNQPPKKELEYLMFEGKGMGFGLDNHINFNYYPQLIEAFEKTNRLKNIK